MATAPSPDSEVQFHTADNDSEVGQGDQFLDQSPLRKQTRPDHSPFPEPQRFLPRFDEIPPRVECAPHMELLHDRDHQPAAGMHVIMKPEPYNGDDDWDEYLSHFQDCAELGRWSDRAKLLFLAASLRGQARTFYVSLIAEDKVSYRTLVNKLNQRFGSTKNQNRWLSKLEMRKRSPGESIAVLGDDIRQMAQRAYYNLDALAQEALALNQLYKVISLEMKCRCIDKDCRTVAEAVDVIERYESIIGDGVEKRKANVRAIDSDTHPKPLAESKPYLRDQNSAELNLSLQQVITRLNRLESRNHRDFDRRSPSYNFNRNCYICDSPNHFMRDCPHRYQTQGHQNQRRQATAGKNTKVQGNDKPLTQ